MTAADSFEIRRHGMAGKTKLCRRIEGRAAGEVWRLANRPKQLGLTQIMGHVARNALHATHGFTAQGRDPLFVRDRVRHVPRSRISRRGLIATIGTQYFAMTSDATIFRRELATLRSDLSDLGRSMAIFALSMGVLSRRRRRPRSVRRPGRADI